MILYQPQVWKFLDFSAVKYINFYWSMIFCPDFGQNWEFGTTSDLAYRMIKSGSALGIYSSLLRNQLINKESFSTMIYRFKWKVLIWVYLGTKFKIWTHIQICIYGDRSSQVNPSFLKNPMLPFSSSIFSEKCYFGPEMGTKLGIWAYIQHFIYDHWSDITQRYTQVS